MQQDAGTVRRKRRVLAVHVMQKAGRLVAPCKQGVEVEVEVKVEVEVEVDDGRTRKERDG